MRVAPEPEIQIRPIERVSRRDWEETTSERETGGDTEAEQTCYTKCESKVTTCEGEMDIPPPQTYVETCVQHQSVVPQQYIVPQPCAVPQPCVEPQPCTEVCDPPTRHIHYTRRVPSDRYTSHFHRPRIGMAELLPTVFFVMLIVIVMAVIGIFLPAQLGLKLFSPEDKEGRQIDDNVKLGSLQERKLSDGDVCTEEPPEPGCLVWDWKQGQKTVGTIINYWCVSTTSYLIYARVECTSNHTWVVVAQNEKLPCNCDVSWLPSVTSEYE